MSDGADESAPARRGSGFTVFLAFAVVAMAVVSLLLSREVKRLRGQLAAAETALVQERTRDSLGPGRRAEPLTLIGADGAERAHDFAEGGPTLLLLTSGDCPHCAETLPVWERVLVQTEARKESRVRIVCVQVDADRPEQLKPAPSQVGPMVAKDVVRSWLREIPISPAALWIDQTGTIRKAWYGIPGQREEGEMASALLAGGPAK